MLADICKCIHRMANEDACFSKSKVITYDVMETLLMEHGKPLQTLFKENVDFIHIFPIRRELSRMSSSKVILASLIYNLRSFPFLQLLLYFNIALSQIA